MKNILNELPSTQLNGRPKFICEWIPEAELDEKHVLNIGCGYGWFERFLADHRKTKRIVGIEPKEENLRITRRGLPDSVELRVADGTSMDFDDESFDICIASEVLEHLEPNKEQMFFEEVNRILKPSGFFYLTTPAKNWKSLFVDPAYWLIGHRHYSEEQIFKYAEKSGFAVSEIKVIGAKYEAIALWDMYISKWIFRKSPILMNLIKNKLNSEYSRTGFFGIFAKLKKISHI